MVAHPPPSSAYPFTDFPHPFLLVDGGGRWSGLGNHSPHVTVEVCKSEGPPRHRQTTTKNATTSTKARMGCDAHLQEGLFFISFLFYHFNLVTAQSRRARMLVSKLSVHHHRQRVDRPLTDQEPPKIEGTGTCGQTKVRFFFLFYCN